MFSRTRMLILTLLLLALTGMLTSCNRYTSQYVLVPGYSVNVARPNILWPKKEEDATPAQQEILDKNGRPDLIRIWWKPTGEFADPMTVRMMQIKAPKPDMVGRETSWVYENRNGGEEVIFKSPTETETKPMSDELRVLCELGDPQQKHQIPNEKNQVAEEWVYHTQGRIYRFINGVKVYENKNLERMPSYWNQ
jgi:hypothetical protein